MRKVTIAILAGLALLLGATAPAWAEDGATVETTVETKDAADCAAYADSEAWCDPASDENYNCNEASIPVEYWPIFLVDTGHDPFGLDDDNDGIGCEGGPDGDAGGAPEEPPAEEPPADELGPCAHYADSAAWCSDTHGDYNCPDIDDVHKPIELFDAELDPFHLDRDADALGCEVGEDDDGSSGDDDGNADDGAGDDDGGAGGAGAGGDGEELPNTGTGDLGPLWLAAFAFLAAGALLVIRRTATQR
ncbi:LPXTG cell wall anchor domain-containing protein [Jiangella alkaliphila]|uniref:LPXTG cell wall anchor domain-containing protein n=1 Tax=Jiangella alkaliphila TaxID=419479 RepID=UPI0006298C1C|nr:LPXTG cell wall anchor domain-containing protein [Jiangella alkaliphila]